MMKYLKASHMDSTDKAAVIALPIALLSQVAIVGFGLLAVGGGFMNLQVAVATVAISAGIYFFIERSMTYYFRRRKINHYCVIHGREPRRGYSSMSNHYK